MERLERFYKIHQLLTDRKTAVAFSILKKTLGVSPATLKRDIEYMRSRFNAPIEYDREANGYRFGEPRPGPRYELPGLWFSADEAYALLTMHTLLAELQPGLLEPHIRPLQDRVRAVLGGEPAWKEVEKRIRVFQPERRTAPTEYFGIIATGVLRRSKLWIRHFNRKENRETERDREAHPGVPAGTPYCPYRIFRNYRDRSFEAFKALDSPLQPQGKPRDRARDLASAPGALPRQLVRGRVLPQERGLAHLRGRRDPRGRAARRAREGDSGRGARRAPGKRLRHLRREGSGVGDAALQRRGGALGLGAGVASKAASAYGKRRQLRTGNSLRQRSGAPDGDPEVRRRRGGAWPREPARSGRGGARRSANPLCGFLTRRYLGSCRPSDSRSALWSSWADTPAARAQFQASTSLARSKDSGSWAEGIAFASDMSLCIPDEHAGAMPVRLVRLERQCFSCSGKNRDRPYFPARYAKQRKIGSVPIFRSAAAPP